MKKRSIIRLFGCSRGAQRVKPRRWGNSTLVGPVGYCLGRFHCHGLKPRKTGKKNPAELVLKQWINHVTQWKLIATETSRLWLAQVSLYVSGWVTCLNNFGAQRNLIGLTDTLLSYVCSASSSRQPARVQDSTPSATQFRTCFRDRDYSGRISWQGEESEVLSERCW